MRGIITSCGGLRKFDFLQQLIEPGQHFPDKLRPGIADTLPAHHSPSRLSPCPHRPGSGEFTVEPRLHACLGKFHGFGFGHRLRRHQFEDQSDRQQIAHPAPFHRWQHEFHWRAQTQSGPCEKGPPQRISQAFQHFRCLRGKARFQKSFQADYGGRTAKSPSYHLRPCGLKIKGAPGPDRIAFVRSLFDQIVHQGLASGDAAVDPFGFDFEEIRQGLHWHRVKQLALCQPDPDIVAQFPIIEWAERYQRFVNRHRLQQRISELEIGAAKNDPVRPVAYHETIRS